MKNNKEIKSLKTRENIRFSSIEGINFFYNNEISAKDVFKEVFVDRVYNFDTTKQDPIVLDAGSNIGLSTLFFKKKFPKAKIICFEPDPYIFPILVKNVALNKLDNVKLINAALSKKKGYIYFYGEFGLDADARGNSIIDVWGKQRKTANNILVETVQLSSYISGEIDLLKLDIEGAEQQVLEELGDKLRFVKNICLEVHEAKGMHMKNNLQKVTEILKRNGFDLTINEIDIQGVLLKDVGNWVQSVSPHLFFVNGQK